MLTRLDLLDTLLGRHAASLDPDLAPNRNDNDRVVIFCAELLGARETMTLEKLSIATAFHDLGIRTEGPFDDLDPAGRGRVPTSTKSAAENGPPKPAP